ncbi:MAG: hypothetical protein WBQ14_06900 [Gaiellaceae bacterium]
MRRSSLAVVTLLTAGLLSVAASSSSGDVRAAVSSSTGATRVLRTQQPVKLIAADGSRIAVATTTQKEGVCDRIVVWSPTKKTSPSFKTSACNDSSTGDDIQDLALTGETALWLETGGGNWRELALYSHIPGTNKTNLLSIGSYSLDAYQEDDYGPFHFIGNLFGAGNLVVYNSWTACMEIPVGWAGATCPQSAEGSHPVLLYGQQKLLRVLGRNSVEIASAPDVQIPVTKLTSSENAVAVVAAVVAVDAKRVAVRFPDGSVTIYSAGGAIVRSIPLRPGKFSGFALQGSQFVAIRSGKLELFNVFSGKLLKTFSVPGGSQLYGLQKGLALYVDFRVHVLRLSDGKDVTFAPPRADYVGAQISTAGLFYAYNPNPSGHAPGRVVFVPLSTILKKLH